MRQAAKQKAQQEQQATSTAVPPDSHASPVRQSTAPLHATTTPIVQSLPVPTATANRNKSKTYMKGMEGRAGRKTVYSERPEEDAVEGYVADVSMMGGKEDVATPVKQNQQMVDTPNAESNTDNPAPLNRKQKRTLSKSNFVKSAETPATSARQHSSTRPRFTAPSALASLPSNMFVTSVYFPWPHGRHAGKAKNKLAEEPEPEPETSFAVDERAMKLEEEAAVAASRHATPSAGTTVSMSTARGSATQTEREKKRRAALMGREYIPPEERLADDAEHAEEDAVDEQIHDTAVNGNAQSASVQSIGSAVDWERAENAWDLLKVIAADNIERLVEGSILAWKVSPA